MRLLLTTILVTSHETGIPETEANTAAALCQNETPARNELTTTERPETSLGVFWKGLKSILLVVNLIYQH